MRPLLLMLLLLMLMTFNYSAAMSLYDEKTYRPLVSDHKAFRVGDAITVQVIENASASSNADTKTRRNNTLAAELAHGGTPIASADVGVNSGFDGGGGTQRTGKLLAQLTVSVTSILPNGDMLIAGEQQLSINDEQQRIRVEGRVRPNDILDTNIVLSSRLADAKIDYSGQGDLSQRQKRAWWRKATDWLGL